MSLVWTSAYVGVPWRDKGRHRSGCDCWGLVKLVWADQRGVVLPSYDVEYGSVADMARIADIIGREAASEVWRPVPAESAEILDILVFRQGRYDCHVGLRLTSSLMLHMREGDSSKIERFDAAAWRSRLVGIFRPR